MGPRHRTDWPTDGAVNKSSRPRPGAVRCIKLGQGSGREGGRGLLKLRRVPGRSVQDARKLSILGTRAGHRGRKWHNDECLRPRASVLKFPRAT